MIARFSGGVLGLLAFALATLAGVLAGNPAEVILSRSLLGLIIFCLIGLAVGAAAQIVINEYDAAATEAMQPPDNDVTDVVTEEDNSTSHPAEPMGT